MGLSASYHLKRDDPKASITVLEAHPSPGREDTSKSAGAFRAVYTSRTNLALADSTVSYFIHVQEEEGFDLGMKFVGYLFLMSREAERRLYPVVEELEKRAAQRGEVVEVLVQVNTSGEETKFGLKPEEVEGFMEIAAQKEHVRVLGLMTIGPLVDDPEKARPCFAMLREIKERVEGMKLPNVEMKHLSMGCLLYTSPSPRDLSTSRMPSSA